MTKRKSTYTLRLAEDEVTSLSSSLLTSINIAVAKWQETAGAEQEFYLKLRGRLELLRDKIKELLKEDVSDEEDEEG